MNNLLKKYKRKLTLFFGTISPFLLTGTIYAGNNNNEEYVTIPNPLRFDTIREFLTALVELLAQLGIALVALMIVVGGAFYMFGGAKPEYVEKGKNIIKWTMLGLFVILLAWVILAVIGWTIGADFNL